MNNVLSLFLFQFGYYSEGEWVDVSWWVILAFFVFLISSIAFIALCNNTYSDICSQIFLCLSFASGILCVSFFAMIIRAIWEIVDIFVILSLPIIAVVGLVYYKRVNSPKRYARLFIDDALKKCKLLTFDLMMHQKFEYGTFKTTTERYLPYVLCFYEYLIFLRQPWHYSGIEEAVRTSFASHYPHGLRERVFSYLDTHKLYDTSYIDKVWDMFYSYIIEFEVILPDTPNELEMFRHEYETLIDIRHSIEEIFTEKHRRSYNPFRKK